MTGMTMDWTLTADQLGTFRGRNSNFNGEGFSRQTFKVHSVSEKILIHGLKKHTVRKR